MMFADEGGRFVAKLLREEMLAKRQRALGDERGEVERDPEVTSMARARVEPAVIDSPSRRD